MAVAGTWGDTVTMETFSWSAFSSPCIVSHKVWRDSILGAEGFIMVEGRGGGG